MIATPNLRVSATRVKGKAAAIRCVYLTVISLLALLLYPSGGSLHPPDGSYSAWLVSVLLAAIFSVAAIVAGVYGFVRGSLVIRAVAGAFMVVAAWILAAIVFHFIFL